MASVGFDLSLYSIGLVFSLGFRWAWFRLLKDFFQLGSGLHFFWAWFRSSLLWVSLGLVQVFTSSLGLVQVFTSLGFFGLGSGLHFFGFLWAWFRSSLLLFYFWDWFRSSLLLGFFGLG